MLFRRIAAMCGRRQGEELERLRNEVDWLLSQAKGSPPAMPTPAPEPDPEPPANPEPEPETPAEGEKVDGAAADAVDTAASNPA